jgi:hypothetical protein
MRAELAARTVSANLAAVRADKIFKYLTFESMI